MLSFSSQSLRGGDPPLTVQRDPLTPDGNCSSIRNHVAVAVNVRPRPQERPFHGPRVSTRGGRGVAHAKSRRHRDDAPAGGHVGATSRRMRSGRFRHGGDGGAGSGRTGPAVCGAGGRAAELP